MIRYKGKNYTMLTDRVLSAAQRSLLCTMQHAKVYDGYARQGLWLNTSMEAGVNRVTLNALLRKKLVKKRAGHVYVITARGREWANTGWTPGIARKVG